MIILIDGDAFAVDTNFFNAEKKRHLKVDPVTRAPVPDWDAIIRWVERNGEPHSAKNAIKNKSWNLNLKRGKGEVKLKSGLLKRSTGGPAIRFENVPPPPQVGGPPPEYFLDRITIRRSEINRDVHRGAWITNLERVNCKLTYRIPDGEMIFSSIISIHEDDYHAYIDGDQGMEQYVAQRYRDAISQIASMIIDYDRRYVFVED